jgi:hypothetical protein
MKDGGCFFGILADKWRIYCRPVEVKLDFCDSIIKAAFCTIMYRKMIAVCLMTLCIIVP